MAPALDPARAAAALAKKIAASPAFTAETVAGNFPEQLAYIKSKAARVLAVCSRRAGKTEANAALLLLTAQATADVVCLYIGLNLTQVKRSAWKAIKKLIRRHKIATTQILESELTIHLPNGSAIYFGSMSDTSTIDGILGASLANGIAILDEIQSVKLGIIEPLVEDIIDPMLTDVTPERPIPGRLVVSGTFRAASGYLWTLWNDPDSEFEKHNWNRLANPFLIDQKRIYEEQLAKKGLTPRLARDWLGLPKFDSTATAFRFDPSKNSYAPTLAAWACNIAPGLMMATTLPQNCDVVAVGIDPGAKDRFAIVWWAWNSRIPEGLWQIGEWVTPRNHGAGWPEAGKVLDLIDANLRGGITFLRYDGGGSTSTLDLFSKTVGRRAITSAKKTDLFGRVEHMASLFAEGRAHVMAGSQLEQDLILATWDPNARAEGKYKWSSAGIHPDVSDAGIYGSEMFWDIDLPKPKTAKTLAQEEDELFQQAMRAQAANAGYGPQGEEYAPQHTSPGGYGPPTD